MASLAPPGADKSHPSAAAPKNVSLRLDNLPAKQAGFGQPQYPRTPSRVDPNNPPWPAYRGYHEYSFAHATMGVRLPTILGKAIDDVVKTLNDEYEEEKIVDLTECISRMEDLMDDLHANSVLTPIIDDGEGDIALWNKEIARYFRGKDFMNAPWLFAEAYKYRRLHSCFSLSKFWKTYDVFFRQKCETFSRSGDAVFELSMRFAEPFQLVKDASPEDQLEAKRLMFRELTQVCLWGNSTDLSLLINMTEEDIKNLQSTGGEHLAATEQNILGNDLDKVWEYISSSKFGSKDKGGRLDIVMDNAGFELYCDCVYADWLIQSGLCREIRFHGKRYSWFVSDVMRRDFDWLLNSMVYGHLFPDAKEEELASLKAMGQRWKDYVKQGVWIYEEHPFWITGWTFWELKNEAPDLFLHLSESDLVIFKGDLNHRKLTYDCHAPPSTPFAHAIGPLATEAGAPPILSLRTVKSDVVVGLSGETADRLDKEEPGWKISGKYAVVLLSDGRKGEQGTILPPLGSLSSARDYISSSKFGSKDRGGRFDTVMDNAGFELYCDCVYADWLIQSGLCREIRFWFVSDVMRRDFDWLLNSMVYGHLFPDAKEEELASLKAMGQRWKDYVKQGKWVYEEHPFWITGYTFWELKNEAPDLFLHLSESDLVIFKGDLNHRKLTYDCHAPPSTPFAHAIGPLATEAGAPPILSLRTVKSDVVVGVSGETADRLDKEEPGWKNVWQ